MNVVVRFRIFFARYRWVRWAVVALLAMTTGWLNHRHAMGIERARDSWGATTEVLVAHADLAPGDPLDAGIVAIPTAMVPDGALTELPARAKLQQRVGRGEMLSTIDITVVPGPAGRARPDTAVVGIIDPLARQAAIGLRVRVVSEGIILAADASITEIADEVVYVSVDDAAAATVAAAAQSGLASLVFLP